jgi:hypothetical protein
MVQILTLTATEPGALDGFKLVCDECGGRIVGTSSLPVCARNDASAHERWHANRKVRK